MKEYVARSFTLAPNPHEAVLNQMSYLPGDKVLAYPRSNPQAAAAMVELIDDLDAQETNRTWHVYTLTRAGEDLPCHIGLSQNVRSTFEHQLMKASEPWGPNLDPVSRAIKIAWGDVTATVTHEYLELEDALRIVVDTTADLLAKSAPLADPIMARRPPEPVEARTWTVYGLYTEGAGWLADGTEVPDRETIYIGRSQQPEKRLQSHIAQSRTVNPQTHIARVIAELRQQGVGIKLLALYDRLTKEEARMHEVSAIRDIKADGAPLQNRSLAGDYAPVMGVEGSNEFRENSRQYRRQYYKDRRANEPDYAESLRQHNRQYSKDRQQTDPNYRLRRNATTILRDLSRRGRPITDHSRNVLTEATALGGRDYLAEAEAILDSREDSEA